MKKSLIHAIVASGAMLTITTFWTSTVVSELFFEHASVAAVKHAIAFYGMPFLVLFMATTGVTGKLLAGKRSGGLIANKMGRMKIIAANGALVMIPSALFLNDKASSGTFDTVFYIVQGIELTVGIVQLILLSKNFREGLRMAGRTSA